MLSLHPQDFKSNNSCYQSYYNLAATPAFSAEHQQSLMHFTMGGVVQAPPTPRQEDDDCMDTDGPLSPRARPASNNTTSSLQYYDNEEEEDEDEAEDYFFPSSADAQQQSQAARPTTLTPPADYNNLDANTVAEALEIARDSPRGARDPVVAGILESALSQLWTRVMAAPESYVMTTGEFAVFNYYQHRFVGNKVAVAARRRFWDNTHA